jgi:hypothetical protein
MKKMALLLFLVLPTLILPAQEPDTRGLTAAVKQLAGQAAAVGNQYAVLIAIDKYKHWNALRHPVADAKEIKEILSRRYYVDRFYELYDDAATKAGIIRLFNQLIGTARPEDGVFIFYAGHGHLDQMSDTGFWIPADGGLDRFEQDNWLPNSQLRGFISKLKARHVVLMSDSCFSGDILNPTRAITPEITSEYFRNAYSRISRQVLTSGASEAVPDVSNFARGLKMALEGNTAPQLDPLMLYNQIRLGMKGTTPLLGDLKDSGHQEGASFLFFLRDPGQQASSAQSTPADSQPSFSVEKPHGTIIVRAGTEGRLFLDAKEMGTVPEGGTARLQRMDVGTHTVAMLFEGDQVEGKTIRLKADEAVSLTFGECVRNGGSIPRSVIKIDGSFDDWRDVRPLFVKDIPDKPPESLDLELARVYLARDHEYLYVRYDIADQTKPSLLRPHNFKEGRYSEYQVVISKPNSDWVSLITGFDVKKNAWYTYIAKKDAKYARVGYGTHKMKVSTLEARYPLSLVKGLIEDDGFYSVHAQVGYNTGEPDWQWRQTAVTESKQLKF